MLKKTVLKVSISCEKCKQKLLQAVSGLEGVDKIEADVAESTLTVTGDADPIQVIARARKAVKFAEVISIGPPPPPPKPPAPEKKPQPEPVLETIHVHHVACPVCGPDNAPSSCSIV